MAIALRLIVLLGLAVIVLLGLRSWLSRSQPPPIDAHHGALRPCGERPNCVCSCDPRNSFAIAALPYRDDRATTETRLARILEALPRTRIERRAGEYWHASAQSALFRFIDDLEFRFDDGAAQVQIRSASRVGYSDLGVNRKRVEAIRAALGRD